MNYYAGHWMMGPTYVCFKHMFCSVGEHLSSMLKNLKPESLEDVKVIEQKLKSHKEGILQYKKNLKMGILRGMVYNQQACVSSKDALRSYFLRIAMKNETGGCNNDRYRDVLREQRRTLWRNATGFCTLCVSLINRMLHFNVLFFPTNKMLVSWPEIPDKMAEFEPAQQYAAFSIIIEKQTWRNPWRAKSVHFQSTTHSCILSLRLFYTTPHSRNLGGNCTTSRDRRVAGV